LLWFNIFHTFYLSSCNLPLKILYKAVHTTYKTTHTINFYLYFHQIFILSFNKVFVQCTIVFPHTKPSFSICTCLYHLLLSVQVQSYSALLCSPIFLLVFPSSVLPLVPILEFSLAIYFLTFCLGVQNS
jgi:hypothetical protein